MGLQLCGWFRVAGGGVGFPTHSTMGLWDGWGTECCAWFEVASVGLGFPTHSAQYAEWMGHRVVWLVVTGRGVGHVAMNGTVRRRGTGLKAGGRILAVLLLVAAAIPGLATTKVTVAQLEDTVAGIRSRQEKDKDAGPRLSALELTERLTTPRYRKLKAELPGEMSQQALKVLADASDFLPLPAGDLVLAPPPDMKELGQIVSRAADFAAQSIQKMPDFYATRTTAQFQDMRVTYTMDQPFVQVHQGFHLLEKSSATVLYRAGREVVQTGNGKNRTSTVTSSSGLTTWGVFGPLLGVVMADVLKGKVGWGHWEQGPAGPLAVFRYAVAEDQSGYTVRYCCFRSQIGQMKEFEAIPAYHGEIAVDAATGVVYRLVVRTDLDSSLPLERSEVAVEYGPVEIGGRTYICPVRSTSISTANALIFHGYTFYVDKKGKPDLTGTRPGTKLKHSESVSEPTVTAINDMEYGDYHQFRGDVKILSPEEVEQEQGAPAVPATATPPAAAAPAPVITPNERLP